MDDYLTLEELYQRTEHEIELPAQTQAAGAPVKVKFRPISLTDYLMLVPLPPPGSEAWPLAEATQRELDWLRGLAADEQERHRAERNDVVYRTIALATLSPTLTVDDARRLASDALVLFNAVLVESGILPRPVAPPAAPPTADAA